MKHLRLVRWLPWLLIAVCPPLLGHCGGALEHGTETGNPPVVEQQKLHVVLHDDGVEVVGEAGSVSPGAAVTVTNTRSGDHAEAIARADGSVNVRVPGTLDDEYEVTVASAGGSQTVRVKASANEATNSMNTSPDDNLSDAQLASASCDSLRATLEQRVSAGFSSADLSCTTDDDCTDQRWADGCYNGCGRSILPGESFVRVRDQLASSLAPLCSEIFSRCSLRDDDRCEPPTSVPQCLAGTCQALDLSSSSCEDLSNTAAARLDELLAGANRECTQDSDCFLYQQPLRCVFTCPGRPTSVAASAVAGLEKGLAHIESYCDVFQFRRTCAGPFPLPCPSPLIAPKAVCIFASPEVPGTPGQCGLTYSQP